MAKNWGDSTVAHFASKVSYNAGAATDDGAGQRPCKGRIFRVGASDTVRTFGEGLGRSTVAHFARKVRGTNIVAALRGLKIHKVMPQSVGHVRYVFVALTLRAK